MPTAPKDDARVDPMGEGTDSPTHEDLVREVAVLREFIREAAENIAGRRDYWRDKESGGPYELRHVSANLDWAAAQLDLAPGHLKAIAKRLAKVKGR